MFGLARRRAAAEAPPAAPVLDLSGPRLRAVFEDLVESAEPTGGVERWVTALALKASLFDELLVRADPAEMRETEFLDLAAFMAPVRRRVGAWLGENGFEPMRRRIAALLAGGPEAAAAEADARLGAFIAAFPADRAHRWARDLGAELLHFSAPERIPLMTRWVWDARVGAGVLREIWFADDVDAARIEVADDRATFATLTAELSGFLKDQGVFRDLPFYVDLLMAHVYAGYINDRGGQYLRADFAGGGDPMAHTRRMLGLDAVASESGRTRLKLIDGGAHVLGALPAAAMAGEER